MVAEQGGAGKATALAARAATAQQLEQLLEQQSGIAQQVEQLREHVMDSAQSHGEGCLQSLRFSIQCLGKACKALTMLNSIKGKRCVPSMIRFVKVDKSEASHDMAIASLNHFRFGGYLMMVWEKCWELGL